MVLAVEVLRQVEEISSTSPVAPLTWQPIEHVSITFPIAPNTTT